MTTLNNTRKIDALVAEHVMGLELRDGLVDMSEELNSKGCWREPKCYSTDIASAWEVIEKLKDSLDLVEIFWDIDCWCCNLWKDGEEIIRSHAHETAPLAICLAALKAKGVRIEDES